MIHSTNSHPDRERRRVSPSPRRVQFGPLALSAAAILAWTGTAHAWRQDGSMAINEFDPMRAISVVAPGTLSNGHSFTASVTGFFNDDSIPDAAVIADGQTYVLLNPGVWDAVTSLGPVEARDLARVRDMVSFTIDGTEILGDGLLVATASGLSLWRWRPDPTAMFVSQSVGAGPGSGVEGPTTLVCELSDMDYPIQLAVYCALDNTQTTLHVRGIMLHQAPWSPVPEFQLQAPITLPQAPLDLALVHIVPGGYPQLAVADGAGLRVRHVGGTQIFNYPKAVTSSTLVPIERDGVRHLPRRLAWMRKTSSSPAQRLFVADSAGLENGISLGNDLNTAAVATAAAWSSGDPNYVDDADVAVGRSDGSVRVLANDCDPDNSGPAATTFDPDCDFVQLFGTSTVTPNVSSPAFADFDLDGWNDVIAWNDSTGEGVFGRRGKAPGEPILFIESFGSVDWGPPSTGGAPSFAHIDLDCSRLLGAGITSVHAIAWACDPGGAYELDPISVGAEMWHVPNPCPGDGIWNESLLLDLSRFQAKPDFVGLELRAVRPNGRIAEVSSFLIVRDCERYRELFCDLGVDPADYNPPPNCPPTPPTCNNPPTYPASLKLGDYILAVLPVPRLPPYTNNQTPVIVWQ